MRPPIYLRFSLAVKIYTATKTFSFCSLLVVLQQQGLVSECVEDVVLREAPSVVLVDLEALPVRPGGVFVLPGLGEPVA